MNQIVTLQANLQELNFFAIKLAAINKPPDIILLQGDLGTGKTTFARLLIKALYYKMNIKPPTSIKSPTFPIMISYDLKKYELYHYDLYRLKKNIELHELDIFENFKNTISIVEWPEILIKELKKKSYYYIRFSFVNSDTRQIQVYHSKEKINFLKN